MPRTALSFEGNSDGGENVEITLALPFKLGHLSANHERFMKSVCEVCNPELMT